MRIFQVLEASANAGLPFSRTWLRNLHEPLLELGHEVVLLDAAPGRRGMQRLGGLARARFSQQLLDKFRREHRKKPFHLFFAYLMDGMVEPGAIDEIRREGVPTCNFSCNNVHQFSLVDGLSAHFDWNLHAERDVGPKFQSIGAAALWWPMASNPTYFKPLPVPRSVAASFVGANYALRARYVARLLAEGVDLHVYGPGWRAGSRTALRAVLKRGLMETWARVSWAPQERRRAAAQLDAEHFRQRLASRYPANVHGPASDDDLIALYSRSVVSLGFVEVYDRHDPLAPVLKHLHLREFEAPMSGALYCTGLTDELAEMFVPDKEVVVYSSEDELVDKVKGFLTHPERGEPIRAAGRTRALADHTYQRRFGALFEHLGLGASQCRW